MVAQWGVVLGASLVAAIWDVKFRRIPNWLTLPLVVTGLAVGAWQGGWPGLGDALAGCFIVALPYVLLFLLGGGAGDAKMMGALGAWLGLRDGVVVLVAVAVVGAIFGMIKMSAEKSLRRRLGGMFAGMYVFLVTARSGKKNWDLLRAESNRQDDEKNENENRHGSEAMMPYGPAIFLGVCIGALVVYLWQG
jgi:prepilin peptidase CpaA